MRAPTMAMRMRTAALALFVVGVAATPANAAEVVDEGFGSFRAGVEWADGSVHGDWKSNFDGYGSVEVARSNSGNKFLSLAPKASTTSGETHASLVTSVERFGDMDVTLRMKTRKQLRSPSPNPWETAWFVWAFEDNTHFYYVVLKPNGWELGKADPAYRGAQRFLATGSDRKFEVGEWNRVRVRQSGSTMKVWVDGEPLVEFTDNERPYERGGVGFYTEDARVAFDGVRVERIS